MTAVKEAHGKTAPTLPDMAGAATPSCPERIRVLLVDDDDDFREAAEMELAHLGFEVVTAASGDALVDFFTAGNRCDAIILDWKLPRRSGIDCLRALRQRNVTTPVVILTGMPEADYESEALDDGADDFVDKARGLCILAKRVRRIVASQNAPASPSGPDIRSGKLLLRTAVSRAFWKGIDLNLTVTEFNILCLMVTHANEHVTYRAIYDCVHHPGFVAGSGEEGYRTNVRSALKRIRNKFRAVEPAFDQIENFSAFGYRWREEEPATSQHAGPMAGAAGWNSPSRKPVPAGERDSGRRRDHDCAGSAMAMHSPPVSRLAAVTAPPSAST